VTAAADDADDDDNESNADGSTSSHSGSSGSSDACVRLSAAVGRFKSLAVRLSHRLTDTERVHVIEDIAAALNIVLDSRRRDND